MKRFLLSALLLAGCANAKDELPQLNLELQGTTVSGLSSGGYMANQFHIAHSDWVTGAGIIGAGPYYCAQNSLTEALGSCVSKRSESANNEVASTYTQQQQTKGTIANLSNLKKSKVWILSGTKDMRVVSDVTDALVSQYRDWVANENLMYISDKPFAHHFPTLASGNECDTSAAPFLGNCEYDAAGEMLQFLLPKTKSPDNQASGKIYTLQQPSLASGSSLADEGYVYIPKSCAAGERCHLHISFHGCNQYAQANGVGMEYVKNTGLNRWADANALVVLYPQTVSSTAFPFNPQGCWDWWGYTDENYATKEAPQIKTVVKMAHNLAGKKQ